MEFRSNHMLQNSWSLDDCAARRQIMSTGTDISALNREFTDALTEVLAGTAGQQRHVSDAIWQRR
jgi:hypothetical protein